jgi:hypothetical protein
MKAIWHHDGCNDSSLAFVLPVAVSGMSEWNVKRRPRQLCVPAADYHTRRGAPLATTADLMPSHGHCIL